ncbi:hypothetical protein GCM10023201_25750 [Actinomycetospora corticicola]|uniref:Uncharacterized protein n=1 Tax=Actinomycetospora corticicola TaxID=663602 RepID=A0A7Y9DXM3_9PSEU|nr:DUF2795 domain-containing protein [Actinomycetospora corticicola]NYD37291.1 hypothetical protein [Actinomycetospora corticicola]
MTIRSAPRGDVLFTPETAPWRVPAPRRPQGPDEGPVRVGPGGRDAAEIRDLFSAVYAGAPWPARPWQLLAHADDHGVDLVTRAALRALPSRVYTGPDDVSTALAALPPVHRPRRVGTPV